MALVCHFVLQHRDKPGIGVNPESFFWGRRMANMGPICPGLDLMKQLEVIHAPGFADLRLNPA